MTVNIGLPGAGPRAFADTEALAREIIGSRMKIRTELRRAHAQAGHRADDRNFAARGHQPIEAALFLGSSPIRRLVEDWTVDHLQRTTEEAVKFAVSAGLPVMYVTEDTIRTDPATDRGAVFDGDSRGRARDRAVRYGGARHAARRLQPGEICDREGREAERRKNSRGLARAQRPRPGGSQFAGRCRRGRRPDSRLRRFRSASAWATRPWK